MLHDLIKKLCKLESSLILYFRHIFILASILALLYYAIVLIAVVYDEPPVISSILLIAEKLPLPKLYIHVLLVNRLWCAIIIPILWSNPTYHFDDSLSALNEKEQALLIPFRIILPKFQSLLSEYTSYATSFDDSHLVFPIKKWFMDEGFITGSRISISINDDDDYLPIMAVKCTLTAMFLRSSEKIKP
ncbi:hypothetical protein F8M41_005631 [Gigaspora margarita]|uniref:Uncharacterized protein n=1 Tax=Gigaspora margarita TaxID=4874 RepID=A0A8H3X9D5_GIGMA|nr:hypothetical protein F8M41_005631 [Gigaspora margarita]